MYNCITAVFIFCGSSLYFSRTSFIIGVNACMRLIPFMLERVSGVNAILMINEKMMITMP